jgi:hypothetical protein
MHHKVGLLVRCHGRIPVGCIAVTTWRHKGGRMLHIPRVIISRWMMCVGVGVGMCVCSMCMCSLCVGIKVFLVLLMLLMLLLSVRGMVLLVGTNSVVRRGWRNDALTVPAIGVYRLYRLLLWQG